MELSVLTALLNNAALLLVLSVVYDAVYHLPPRYRRWYPMIGGVLIGLICVAVMSMPLRIQSGIVYDARSILISVTALIFGAVPAVITAGAAAVFRLIVGGPGVPAGLATIFSSALVGLAWRRWLYPDAPKWQWLNVYAMSICVHLIMITCQLLLPYPDNLRIIRAIAVPVLLVFPVVSVLLCLLLLRQQAFRHTQQQLKQSEERFKMLFDKAPLGYQSLDSDGHFLEVNQQWCDLLGYTRDEVIGKWFGEFLSPDNRDAFLKRFPIFKAQGYVHSEFEVLHKSGRPIMIAFEGRIGYGNNGEFRQTHCVLQDVTSQRAAEAALAESEKKYRSIAENVSDVVWQMDLNLKTTYVSPSVEKILGETPEEYLTRKLEDSFREETLQKIHALLAEEMEKEKDPGADKSRSRTVEVEYLKTDGTAVWLEINVSVVRDAQGSALGFLGVSRDIMQRKLAEQALAESERSKSVFLSNLPGLAYRCRYDRDGTMLYVSDGCFQLTGYLPDSFINNRDLAFNDIIEPEYREALYREWERAIPGRLPYRCEYVITTAAGERKWVLEVGRGVYGRDGEAEALEGVILDISEKKEMENHLKYANEHDRWTGLYNREYLESMLKKDIGKRDGKKRAIISVNLSTVQLLTGNYGFHYTQNLIKEAARALSRYCGKTLMLFQTYENRFVFYLKDYNNQNELVDFGKSIADTLEGVFVTDRITGGIGILEIQRDDTENDVDLLLRRLLITSERSIAVSDKDFGITFYNDELEAIVTREGDIRHAISAVAADKPGDDLFLQYQPIYHVKTDSIFGFEALARLRSQKLGLVPPVEFIPVAEKTKLIIPIGEKIIVSAFRFLNKLKARGYGALSVSVNISAIQLLRPDFTARMMELVRETQVDPGNIGIEITESVFASDYAHINRIIEKLQEAGIYIAIDDFGTGYSSLARERELSVDCLKIDKSFIDRLRESNPDNAITGDIISMAHKLGHFVIAEGVEHESQLTYLKEHGCDNIQGYLISKPLDEEAAIGFLEKFDGNAGRPSSDGSNEGNEGE